MITNSNGVKVSAKEAAKEALAQAVKDAVEKAALNGVGGPGVTDKEFAKVQEQLEKISARLLSKLTPASTEDAPAVEDTAAEQD